MAKYRYTVIVCVACVLTYWNSLNGDMVFDDIPAIVSNRDVRPSTPFVNIWYHDFWGTPIHLESSHKSYRPLATLTFRLNYAVSQLSTRSYHFVNIVLHTVVCLLFQRLCKKFLRLSERSSFLASLLFAVHPVHTEAVSSIVGRAELLSAIFYIGALILISQVGEKDDHSVAREPGKTKTSTIKDGGKQQRCLGAVCLAFLGCLCKEQCFAFFPLSALYLYLKQYRNGVKINGKTTERRSITIVILSSFLILAARVLIMGGNMPKFSRLDNPIAELPFGVRLMNKAHWSALNVWLCLFPADLSCDWTSGSLTLITTLKDYRNLASALTSLGVGALFISAFRSKEKGQSNLMSIGMIIIPYFPASNWFLPVGFVLAERTLYLPSMGICALLAVGSCTIFKITRQRFLRLIFQFMLGCLLLSHIAKTIKRNQDWSNEIELYKSGLEIVPNNTKLLNNYGKILEKLGHYSEALVYYEKAIGAQEKDVRSYVNAGNLLHSQSFSSEAENYLKKAVSIVKSEKHAVSTTELRAFIYLTNVIATNKSRLNEAVSFINEALDLRSDFSAAYIQKGELLLKMNRSADAVKMFKNALDLDLTSGKLSNPSFLNNYGALLLEMGQDQEAFQAFSRALSQDPNLQSAHINLALLVQETQSEMTRNAAIIKLQELAHDQSYQKDLNETLYFRLGMLALDRNDTVGAKNNFKKALEVNPTFQSALYNLSLLLTRENKVTEAIGFLERLIKFHPNHVNGRKLLNKIRDSE